MDGAVLRLQHGLATQGRVAGGNISARGSGLDLSHDVLYADRAALVLDSEWAGDTVRGDISALGVYICRPLDAVERDTSSAGARGQAVAGMNIDRTFADRDLNNGAGRDGDVEVYVAKPGIGGHIDLVMALRGQRAAIQNSHVLWIWSHDRPMSARLDGDSIRIAGEDRDIASLLFERQQGI